MIPGAVLGDRFEIEQSIGSGGMGTVFRARDPIAGDVVAVKVIERGPLTLSDAVTLATRVAEALGAAHAHGSVHHDLKPSNLILPGGRIDQVKIGRNTVKRSCVTSPTAWMDF